MKPLLFALLVLAVGLPLRADNWLQNGDFADGIDHWHGDGRAPADFAAENPFDKPDPFTSKGLIIPLKHLDWTKVAQDFKGRVAGGILTLTFMVSPDFAPSKKPEDYTNVAEHIGYDGWTGLDMRQGQCLVLVTDFQTAHGTSEKFTPKLGSTSPQTLQTRIGRLTPLEEKTIMLAFPPGAGRVVILNVSLTN